MEQSPDETRSPSSAIAPPPADSSQKESLGIEQRALQISALLRTLDESAAESGKSLTPTNKAHQNRLVQVRLGLASSLFTALSCKHAPTAAHCLRVALGSSSWTMAMELDEDLRDCIEVAALLHDIGKIGVPDRILLKPGKLTPDEAAVIDRHRSMGLEILGSCCASEEVLQIVKYANARYDGERSDYPLQGDDIPLGARIVAIVDAFDAMTTDHVYRPAFSRERALAELLQCAGTQFDPDLVRRFARFHNDSQYPLDAKVAQQWLQSLATDQSNVHWRLGTPSAASGAPASADALFGRKLLDNMHDGVVFVDSQMRIFLWNRGAEQLTGVASGAVFQRLWCPTLLRLRDEDGNILRDDQCPVAQSMATGMAARQRLHIVGRDGEETPIDLHIVPVTSSDGVTHGATVMLHDASSEQTLEEHCQNLHEQVSKDPLTQVANRAEFDRMHDYFVEAHLQLNRPYSLVICDIDHFKQVNDTFGHQAGDDAIISFAALLKSHCRAGDQVARYGGEEFVVMCSDCTNATAYQRAEELRRDLATLPQPMLGGRSITASFGVTELQPGDTTETMLRRADRALLQAKDRGRNMVVQLGSGMGPVERKWRWWPFVSTPPSKLVESHLVTAVPLEIAVEKLRGFVSDHDATITSIGDDFISLSIERAENRARRRRNDRPIPMVMELKFSEVQVQHKHATRLLTNYAETKIHLVIGLKRDRERRREVTVKRARQMLASFKSYLMAHEDLPERELTMLSRAKSVLTPWRRRKK
ncbi:MAG: diguanylate cyclase [Pirellulales bacterium]